MPKYSFECQQCVIRFERRLKIEEHLEHKCPSCKGPAPRVFDGEGLNFAFRTESGTAAANSGVHKDDYPTADQAVGRSASDRWEILSQRDRVKNEARKLGGTHALIRTGTEDYIDYEPMTQTGRDARRALARAAMAATRKEKD